MKLGPWQQQKTQQQNQQNQPQQQQERITTKNRMAKIHHNQQAQFRMATTIVVLLVSVLLGRIPQTHAQSSPLPRQADPESADYSCNPVWDACSAKENGVCDNSVINVDTTLTLVPGCDNGDCFDCNSLTCGTLDFDCEGCLTTTGCFWCPTSGRCYNSDTYRFPEAPDACGDDDQGTYVAATTTTPPAEGTCTSATNFFSDPSYSLNAWIYDMIHILPVWEQGILGNGIRIRINDDGVVPDNPEYADRFDVTASCTSAVPIQGMMWDGVDNAKYLEDGSSSHGTAVASIVAGGGNNDICAVGIAPEATISSCHIYDSMAQTSSLAALAFSVESFDISQNSFGIPACTSRQRLNNASGSDNSAVGGGTDTGTGDDNNNDLPGEAGTASANNNDTNTTTDDTNNNTTDINATEENIFIRDRTQRRQRTTTRSRFLQDDTALPTSPAAPGTTTTTTIDACPFEQRSNRLLFPCDVCTFPLSPDDASITEECRGAMIQYCQFYYTKEEEACLSVSQILLIGGLASGGCHYDLIPQSELEHLTTGVTEGRDGKGIIYVFSSGNNLGIGGEDVNFSELTSSRLTITVGAVTKDGTSHAPYSTPGAALFVSAPGGDLDHSSNIVYSASSGDTCRDGIGTDLASPIVSGVIALMLEVNPELTWRDVQGILAETSEMVFAPDDATIVVNGNGLSHSNWFGFGMIHAENAVLAAKSWVPFRPEQIQVADSGDLGTVLNDTPELVTSTAQVLEEDMPPDGFVIESTVLVLNLEHFSRGDLEVILTSPAGTHSILHPGARFENTIQAGQPWRLMTVRNWGESPVGEWTLSLRDMTQGKELLGCNDSPFSALVAGEVVTCQTAVERGSCTDGTMEPGFAAASAGILSSNGMTLAEACCACGGGNDPATFEDILTRWRLLIYGREPGAPKPSDSEITAAPEPSDSGISGPPASGPESFFPSDEPSILPSEMPSAPDGSTPARTPSTPTSSSSSGGSGDSSSNSGGSGETASKDQLFPEEDQEKWTEEKIATIVASISAFALICVCLACSLRGTTPKGQQWGGGKVDQSAGFFKRSNQDIT